MDQFNLDIQQEFSTPSAISKTPTLDQINDSSASKQVETAATVTPTIHSTQLSGQRKCPKSAYAATNHDQWQEISPHTPSFKLIPPDQSVFHTTGYLKKSLQQTTMPTPSTPSKRSNTKFLVPLTRTPFPPSESKLSSVSHSLDSKFQLTSSLKHVPDSPMFHSIGTKASGKKQRSDEKEDEQLLLDNEEDDNMFFSSSNADSSISDIKYNMLFSTANSVSVNRFVESFTKQSSSSASSEIINAFNVNEISPLKNNNFSQKKTPVPSSPYQKLMSKFENLSNDKVSKESRELPSFDMNTDVAAKFAHNEHSPLICHSMQEAESDTFSNYDSFSDSRTESSSDEAESLFSSVRLPMSIADKICPWKSNKVNFLTKEYFGIPESNNNLFKISNNFAKDEIMKPSISLIEMHKISDSLTETSHSPSFLRDGNFHTEYSGKSNFLSLNQNQTANMHSLCTEYQINNDKNLYSDSFAVGLPSKSNFESNYFESCYDIVDLLGHGSFANVYKVIKKSTGGIFAVKKTRSVFSGTIDRNRKLQEVQNMWVLQGNSNVANIQESWEQDGHLYLVIEYCENGTLRDFARQGNNVNMEQLWFIAHQIALGLFHMHSRGIIHLDLKPENILFTEDYTVKLSDFGMSRQLISSSINPSQADDCEGDKIYIAPEVLQGIVGKSADIFSFGLILLEMAANIILPSQGDTWLMLRNDNFSLIKFEQNVPSKMIEMVFRMLRSVPSERLTIEEVLSEIEKFHT